MAIKKHKLSLAIQEDFCLLGMVSDDPDYKLCWAINQALGMDERPYYQVLLADLKPDLPEALTPKRVGSLCRAMGLTLRRRSNGYLVTWNDAQLKILREYFRI